ncbi:hypothetical protein ACFVXG_15575 [Kitasatospora sp. NPDC058162]|uniref:hypothetical protein n=1 Tax=Kitasatospora sp. NPDC058162 TaxID=3346362 RepID=UPI0036D85B18
MTATVKGINETDVHSCPGLGRQVGDRLHRPNDERYVVLVEGTGSGTTYKLSPTAGGTSKLPPVKWDQKNSWFAPPEGQEEVWSAAGRPGWYWEIVAKAAVTASSQLGPARGDLEQLGIVIPAVFQALAEVLGVERPTAFTDLSDRIVPMPAEEIALLGRVNSILPAGKVWDDYLTLSDLRALGSGNPALVGPARQKIENLGPDMLLPPGPPTPTPALSRAQAVAVHQDVMKDQPPADINYRLALVAARHPLARRHLLAHELMHAHSSLGYGFQDVSTHVDEAYTEVLGRLVTDALTAVEAGVATPALATDPAAQRTVAGSAQYNVFPADSREAEQAKGALRYQKNIWALARVDLSPERKGGIPAQVRDYFFGRTPGGIPVVGSVLNVSTPGAGPVLPLARRAASQQAPVYLYMPDEGPVDYHLLVVPGPPAHAVLIDCGCDDRAQADAVVAELRETFQQVLPTAPDGRKQLGSVIISRAVPRRYNMLAAATRGLSVGAVYHASPAEAYNAPALGGGTKTSEWLKAHGGQEFPAAFSTLRRPLLTAGAAGVYVLGAHLDGSTRGPAGASGSAVLLITYGGLRLILTSDADAAAAQAIENVLKGAGSPAVFTHPAALAVATGRPNVEAGRGWPWTQGMSAQPGPPLADNRIGHPRRTVVTTVVGGMSVECGAVFSTAGNEAAYGLVEGM